MEFHKDRRRALRRHHKARMVARYADAMRHGMWGFGLNRPEPTPRMVAWTARDGSVHLHDARRRWTDNAGVTRHYLTWEDVFAHRRQVAAHIADHARVCTCGVCGNPRHLRAEATIQERKQMQDELSVLILDHLVPETSVSAKLP